MASATGTMALVSCSGSRLSKIFGEPAPGLPPCFSAEALSSSDEATSLRADVAANPRAFDAWMRLAELSEIHGSAADQKAVYIGVLAEFPLCWGFWKKLAELEGCEHGPAEALATYERGVAVAGACVNLWVEYCKAACEAAGIFLSESGIGSAPNIASLGAHMRSEDQVRSLFERAIQTVGRDWNVGPLWQRYIDFEEAGQRWRHVGDLYRRALLVPMADLGNIFARLRAMMGRPNPPPLEELCTREEASELVSVNIKFEIEVAELARTMFKGRTAATHLSSKEYVELALRHAGTMPPQPPRAVQQAFGLTDSTSSVTESSVSTRPPRRQPAGDDELEEGEIAEDLAPVTQTAGRGWQEENASEQIARAAEIVQRVVRQSSSGANQTERSRAEVAEDTRPAKNKTFDEQLQQRRSQWFLERRLALHVQANAEAKFVSEYECLLQRTYFHNQPLSADQLDAWRRYLDFEESRQPRDSGRLHALYKRCLVATNHYLEFWLRYIAVWERDGNLQKACDTIEEAFSCGRFRQRADMANVWAELEEQQGRVEKAREILDAALQTFAHGSIELISRRAAIEHRLGDLPSVAAVFKGQIQCAPDSRTRSFLTQLYVRFCEEELSKLDWALEAYEDAWKQGCRGLTFLVDFSAFCMRCDLCGDAEQRMKKAIALFEDVLDPASPTYNLQEAPKVWVRYIDFMLQHGAPIHTLRKGQARARSVRAKARAMELDSQAASVREAVSDNAASNGHERALGLKRLPTTLSNLPKSKIAKVSDPVPSAFPGNPSPEQSNLVQVFEDSIGENMFPTNCSGIEYAAQSAGA